MVAMVRYVNLGITYGAWLRETIYALRCHAPFFIKRIKMSKYDMCEAMYARLEGVVEPRRRSMLALAVVVLVGVAVLAVNILCIENTVDTSNLKSALALLGAVLVIVGIIYAMMRRSGEPYHLQDGCFLCKKELKFYKDRNREVVDLVNRADFTTLHMLPEDGVSAVTVVLYTSPCSDFCAAQVFEYEEMEMRPTSNLVIKA